MGNRVSRRDLFRTSLRATAAAALASAIPGCSDSGESEDDLLGAGYGPRPFYVVGHNPNTIAEVKAALAAGANALEPDVNVFDDGSGRLCISHGKGGASAPTIEQYLTDLHAVAAANPQLALIVFDCKPPAVSPANGKRLLDAIRTHLTYDNKISVILSVSALESASMFDIVESQLGPREGVMVDEENDPVAVSKHFNDQGVVNHGYGNGISVLSCGILGPNVRPSMEHACGIRASGARPRFIYVWTVDCEELQEEYMRIGVDGVITDDPAEMRAIMSEPEFKSVVRLATRDDNPFLPGNYAYALTIKTGNVGGAGTDANVTFTLTGTRGFAKKTVDTKFIKRMESGSTNYVTIQSPDLGPLVSITVQRDDTGNGPGWFLEYIQVASARYGVAAQVTYNKWIDDTVHHTIVFP